MRMTDYYYDKDGNLIESAIPGIRIYYKKNIAFR